MNEDRQEIKKRLAIIRNKSNSISIAISLIKWIFIGIIVGALTGCAAALFLKSLEIVTDLRIRYTWLLFILPFGGAFVSYLYSKYGKNSSKGNNLIIEKINDNNGEVPLRMAPLVFLELLLHIYLVVQLEERGQEYKLELV